jgi:hypothetical protein
LSDTKHPLVLGHPKLLIGGIAVLAAIAGVVAKYRFGSAPSPTPTIRWLHRLSASYVFWRTGFTHWSIGPGIYTYDPYCPLCRFARLFHR